MAAMPVLIKEKPPESTHTKHDQLYKELINTFLKEFLEAFFPDVYKNINFHRIKPLSEEVYTNLLDGAARRLDIVMETTLKDTDVVIIVHIEPQSYRQSDFNERMYHYFSPLYNKYQKPIIPIAVFSYDDKWEEKQYTMGFPFFHVLTFNYMTLHLRKKNWRDYIRSDNPAAAALLSQMDYDENERVQVKKEFLRMITQMELNPAKQRLLYGFFETYLKLTKEEEEQLMDEVNKLPEADKIFEIPISYEEKGKVIGKKEVVIEMLKEELDLHLIAKVTHLDIEEIKKMKQQL
ncbi:Rpn family recombination-promoting nuclease/putative transposase [Amphibacillus sp. Q70]|uniref:Rpn family recombination-promoting nuclease/putative transposase n=1 Tax=Amphibacillus sp. Q70 TaxID=3453416 RepID=UPI003F86D3F7